MDDAFDQQLVRDHEVAAVAGVDVGVGEGDVGDSPLPLVEADAVADPERGAFLTMLAYYSGVLEPAFTSKFMKFVVPRGTAGWVDADEAMSFLNKRLADQPYIAG